MADIATFAAHVLSDPAPHTARTYTLTGPSCISFADGWGDHTTTDFADVLGHQPRSFKQFAHDLPAHDSSRLTRP